MSTPRRTIRFGRPGLWAIAAACLAAGVIVLIAAFHTGPRAPRPDTHDAHALLGPITTSQQTSAPAAKRNVRGPAPSHTPGKHQLRTPAPTSRASLPPATTTTALPPSPPTQLLVPAIGVSTSIMQLGLKTDGTIQVPPLSRNSPAGWYRYSATPGQHGSAVILGHIDSAAYGPAVFFRLGALHTGDEIDVHRADNITAVFRVDRVAQYPKKTFPTRLVYGATPYSSLRLITCGGSFNANLHSYNDNIVVYATLTSSRR